MRDWRPFLTSPSLRWENQQPKKVYFGESQKNLHNLFEPLLVSNNNQKPISTEKSKNHQTTRSSPKTDPNMF